jgi:kinesin family protein 3/17
MVGDLNLEEDKGIIPRSFQHIINIVENSKKKKFLIRCSYMEIYNEEIRDLLGKDVKAKRDLKESPNKGICQLK